MSSQIPDLDGLQDGPLTMTLLIGLSSIRLRRLLKAGLKRGVRTDDLRIMLEQDWGMKWDSADASALLDQLASKGWFIQQKEHQIWKTRLGQRTIS